LISSCYDDPCRFGIQVGWENILEAKELIATGVGDVPQWLADDGLELAVAYFEDNNIDPALCYQAKISDPDGDLAKHWDNAERKASQVLLSNPLYEFSMISLEFE